MPVCQAVRAFTPSTGETDDRCQVLERIGHFGISQRCGLLLRAAGSGGTTYWSIRVSLEILRPSLVSPVVCRVASAGVLGYQGSSYKGQPMNSRIGEGMTGRAIGQDGDAVSRAGTYEAARPVRLRAQPPALSQPTNHSEDAPLTPPSRRRGLPGVKEVGERREPNEEEAPATGVSTGGKCPYLFPHSVVRRYAAPHYAGTAAHPESSAG
jgi:hypothetical protein